MSKQYFRIITIRKYNAYTKPLFKSLTLHKSDDILKLQELKFYFKYSHNLLPCYFSKPFNNDSEQSKSNHIELKLNTNDRNNNTWRKANLHGTYVSHK